MGLIDRLFSLVFGGDRNVVAETVEVFRENAEAGAQRSTDVQMRVLEQFAAEFERARPGWFDQIIDALNRLPRPAMALGTLGLMGAAMTDPVWFGERMQGLALVPEPLWWLMGAVVSFYFGARHQIKTQQFQRSILETMAHAPQVVQDIKTLRGLRNEGEASSGDETLEGVGFPVEDTTVAGDVMTMVPRLPVKTDGNPVLEDWLRWRNGQVSP